MMNPEKIFIIGQIVLGTIMLALIGFSFIYHLLCGNLNLFTGSLMFALVFICYKLFRWSVTEHRRIKS